MKKINRINILFFFLYIFFSISSCSIEKRIYRPGYHLQTNKKPLNETSSIEKKTEPNGNTYRHNLLVDLTCENKINISENKTSNNDIKLSQVDRNNKLIEYNDEPLIKPKNVDFNSIKSIKEEFDNTNEIRSNQNDVNPTKNYVYDLLGVTLIILGFTVFLFLSIVIGVVMAALGIGIAILGNTSNKSAQKSTPNQPTQKLDVVHLKNGSIMKGTIIEQVPNEYIKLETRDGNIFVFKTDEIKLIVKE
jgi:Na+-transporting methylmalonyl-CoA/oxaloacetate decarboxylase gamma subunit